jgi:Protein of unknown function (DUF4229)
VSPWIQYSLVRLGLFGVSFGLLMAVSVDWWWAAIIATIIAMTVSYIFFSSLRDAVALDLAARRERPAADPDSAAEDAAEDAADDAAEDAARP